ncbi:phospholipid scramblase 2-like isoform X2 [Ornithodoros turicata]|uniref:phospholipid scramblase 2-like isoform X2 n=1 Tax=Ornithodoros turicata TaxID=34597 RepID=UPI00313924A5
MPPKGQQLPAQQTPLQPQQLPVQRAQQSAARRPPPRMPMPVDAAAAACPPGLEYLCVLDQLVIKQQIELFEVLVGFETQNKYLACNNQGQSVYYMVESSDFCTRCCISDARCFQMFVVDNQCRAVMRFVRPLRCESTFRNCCFCCLLQDMQVETPPNQLVGSVREVCSVCQPTFHVCDTSGKPVLRVQGPVITTSCPGAMDVKYKILTLNGKEIGIISKLWGGVLKEMLTDADTFSVTFPVDLDVRVKACLIGCAMLFDYMYFETDAQDRS